MLAKHSMASLAVAVCALASTAQAQYGGYGGFGGYSGSNPYSGSGSSSGFGSGSSSSGSGSGSSGFGGGNFSFDSLNFSQLTTLRLAHGIMAALAWVIFFPAGAISIRLLPGRLAFWAHVVFQVLGYLVWIAAFAIGVYLARQIHFGSFNLISTYHPIIGIVVFALIIFQPVLGYIHHLRFKKYHRRTFWSYAHIWLGRIVITVAIINGGLGLRLSSTTQSNTRTGEIVYGVVAGIIWLIWMAAAVYGEIKKARTSGQGKEEAGESPPRYSATFGERGGSRRHASRRRSSSRHGRGGRPSQTPLMTENTAYGGAQGGSRERSRSQVREYYGSNTNQGERTWV